MGLPLWRAWEVCRVLDHDDLVRDWDNEIARAMVLSDTEPAPAISPPTPRLAPALDEALPEPPEPPEPPAPEPLPPADPPPPPAPAAPARTIAQRDPEAAARLKARRQRRLGA